ncbi:hypothetical protein OQA88_12621 [Cercophora sp. LCS_1]
METIHARLRSDVEVQDYHFLLDPVDHHHRTDTHEHFVEWDNIPQRQLQEAFPHSTIRVHFNPTTGEMSVSTISQALHFELQHLLVNKLRHCIAAHPQAANSLQVGTFPEGNAASEVPPLPGFSLSIGPRCRPTLSRH